MDKLKLSIGNSFLIKNQGCVPAVKFANVLINTCNGSISTCFVDARISFETGQSVILAMFWHEAIYNIMKNMILNDDESPVDSVFITLISFINNDQHRQCLRVLHDSQSEADVQTVLAHHFFAPLSATGKYTTGIDANRKKSLGVMYVVKKSAMVKHHLVGHIDVWHGHADIRIEKSVVKVETIKLKGDENKEDDEDEDILNDETGDSEEPPRKVLHHDSDGESLTYEIVDFNGSLSVDNESLPQILVQTIVNAFYESSKNPHLADYYIPSFLATPKYVSIHMYNCKRDRLYTSVDLPIWDSSGEKLNLTTVITVWFALNFDKLANCVPDEEFSKRHIPASNFKTCVGNSLAVYTNSLTKPLKDAGKKRIINRNFGVANEFLTLHTEYYDNIASSLQEIQELFEKKLS